jgi:hypothetical protein
MSPQETPDCITGRATIRPVSPPGSFPQLWKNLWKTGTNSAVAAADRHFSGLFSDAKGINGCSNGICAYRGRKARVKTVPARGESLRRPIPAVV